MNQRSASKWPESTCWLALSVISFALAIPRLHLTLLNQVYETPNWPKYAGGLSYTLSFYALLFAIAAFVNRTIWLQGESTARFIVQTAREWMSEFVTASQAVVRQLFCTKMLVAWVPPTLIAAYLRWIYLFEPMRYDEAYTVNQYVDQAPMYLMRYSDPNNHVLHTLLVKLSVIIGGYQEAVIRTPALISGLLTIPIIVWLFSRIAGKAMGHAGWLLAVWPQHILYSVNARGYTLQALLVLLICGLVLVKWYEIAKWRGLFAILCGLALLAMPTSLFVLLGAVLFCAVKLFQQQRSVRSALLGCAELLAVAIFVTGLLYSPVIAVSNGPQAITSNPYVQPRPFAELLTLLPQQFLKLGSYLTHDIIRPLKWLLMLGLLATLIRRALQKEKSNLMLDYGLFVVCCAIGTLFMISVQRVVPYERTWLMYLPLMLLPMVLWSYRTMEDTAPSTSMRSLVASLWRMAWIVCLAVQIMYLTRFMPLREWTNLGEFVDAKPIAEFLVKQNITRDRVDVSVPEGAPLDYYFRRFGGVAFSGEDAKKEYFVVDRTVHDVEDLTSQPAKLIHRARTGEVYQVVSD